MPPQTSRYPTPAVGDTAAPTGRHRRPESLADVAFTSRSSSPKPAGPQRTRHQRATGPGRHAVAPTRPSSGGSHRAAGMMPALGSRRQILLASLVAIGLLLVAVPASQRRGVEAVNAAAQRALGVAAPAKKKPAVLGAAAPEADKSQAHSGQHAVPTPSTSASAPSTVAPAVGPKNPAKPPAGDLGPGRSLRTTGSKSIALTFDDGPDPAQTPRILALLDKYHVKATFCLVGEQVQKHPEVVRQIVADGQTLCNHTWNHSLTIGKETPEQIRADLQKTDAAIRAAVPDAKIPFFRAPGGNFTERLVGVADQFGMSSLYWAVDPRDWDHPKGETDPVHVNKVIAEVQKHARPGAIILSHDFNQPDTIEAYGKLIPWLQEHFTIGMPGAQPPAQAPTTPATPTATPSGLASGAPVQVAPH
jgi:peptidoglycan/xylan/chitin deacetylase (PgdA/CDA1 family)